jgi:hypothetical protein
VSCKQLTAFVVLACRLNALAVGRVENTARAKSSDVAQAERFLADLPSACSSSHAHASTDGTVNIRIICNGSGKSMDGIVSI